MEWRDNMFPIDTLEDAEGEILRLREEVERLKGELERAKAAPAAIVVCLDGHDAGWEHHGFEVDGEDAAALFGSPRGRELIHLKSWHWHGKKG